MKPRYHLARRALLFWCLFIGLGAVGGAVCMLADPTGASTGMDGLLPGLRKLPFADVLFQNLLFSGISLLLVNGLSNLTAAWLLLRRKKAGDVLGTVFGVTLMLWITIQFFIFPANILSISYFIFGLCQLIAGLCALVFRQQEAFSFDPLDYLKVGTNEKRLVVYFSRMGYTQKLAYEAADATGAMLYSIRPKEKTGGTGGFWWCGRYGLHRWEMPIEEPPFSLAQFDHITICTPIWVFAICGPVRAFCRMAAGQVKEADYILVHHNKATYRSAAAELDALLGCKRTACRSVCCRRGSYRAETQL